MSERAAGLVSVLTCPHCGHAAAETMPEDACLVVFDCPGCEAPMRPRQGDCCVFCSFGSVRCPPARGVGRCG